MPGPVFENARCGARTARRTRFFFDYYDTTTAADLHGDIIFVRLGNTTQHVHTRTHADYDHTGTSSRTRTHTRARAHSQHAHLKPIRNPYDENTRERVCCVRVRNAVMVSRGDKTGEGNVWKKQKTRTEIDTQARARSRPHQVRCFTALREPGSLFHHARGNRRQPVVCA